MARWESRARSPKCSYFGHNRRRVRRYESGSGSTTARGACSSLQRDSQPRGARESLASVEWARLSLLVEAPFFVREQRSRLALPLLVLSEHVVGVSPRRPIASEHGSSRCPFDGPRQAYSGRVIQNRLRRRRDRPVSTREDIRAATTGPPRSGAPRSILDTGPQDEHGQRPPDPRISVQPRVAHQPDPPPQPTPACPAPPATPRCVRDITRSMSVAEGCGARGLKDRHSCSGNRGVSDGRPWTAA